MSLGGAVRVFLAELGAVGLDPAAVCTQAGVDPRVLEGDAVPLPLSDLTRVLASAEAISGDALLGLHMAERTPGRGVLAYLARAQRTVGEGLDAFARFAADTWGAGDVVRVARRGTNAVVAFQLSPELPRHLAEYLVGRTAIALHRSRAPAREVRFQHPPGASVRDYEHALRCPVRFRHAETAVVLHGDDLARPLRTANPEAAAALAAGLAGSTAPSLRSTADRLAAALETALAAGESASREALARRLGMSGKTLARRLAAEQRRFSDVVDDVRRATAQRLIADASLDLGEVAAAVGFADLAALGKAFRRWFGESPSSYRARRSSAAG